MTLLETIAALRDAGRPDAAQALEDRTEEEWRRCEDLEGTGISRTRALARDTLYNTLSAMFWLHISPEGFDYWKGVLTFLQERKKPQ